MEISFTSLSLYSRENNSRWLDLRVGQGTVDKVSYTCLDSNPYRPARSCRYTDCAILANLSEVYFILK
jgi:hypothetical protein